MLIGIANHDGDGGAWPTVNTLAHYARLSTRQVQRVTVELERYGEIVKHIQDGGTREVAHYDRPNLYEFTLRCPKHCDGSKNHKLICQKPDCKKPLPKSFQQVYYHPKCAPTDPVTPASPGDAHVTRGASPVSPKPSLEPEPQLNEARNLPERTQAREESDASGDAPTQVAIAPDEADAIGDALPVEQLDHDLDLDSPDHTAAQLETSTDTCPRWPALNVQHALDRNGDCIDCDYSSPVNPTTGELK